PEGARDAPPPALAPRQIKLGRTGSWRSRPAAERARQRGRDDDRRLYAQDEAYPRSRALFASNAGGRYLGTRPRRASKRPRSPARWVDLRFRRPQPSVGRAAQQGRKGGDGSD